MNFVILAVFAAGNRSFVVRMSLNYCCKDEENYEYTN